MEPSWALVASMGVGKTGSKDTRARLAAGGLGCIWRARDHPVMEIVPNKALSLSLSLSLLGKPAVPCIPSALVLVKR